MKALLQQLPSDWKCQEQEQQHDGGQWWCSTWYKLRQGIRTVHDMVTLAQSAPSQDYPVPNVDLILSMPLQVQDALGSTMAVTHLLHQQKGQPRHYHRTTTRASSSRTRLQQQIRFAQPGSMAPVIWAREWHKFHDMLQDHVSVIMAWPQLEINVHQGQLLHEVVLRRNWQHLQRWMDNQVQPWLWQLLQQVSHSLQLVQQELNHVIVDQWLLPTQHRILQHFAYTGALEQVEEDFDIVHLRPILATSMSLEDLTGTMTMLDIICHDLNQLNIITHSGASATAARPMHLTTHHLYDAMEEEEEENVDSMDTYYQDHHVNTSSSSSSSLLENRDKYCQCYNNNNNASASELLAGIHTEINDKEQRATSMWLSYMVQQTMMLLLVLVVVRFVWWCWLHRKSKLGQHTPWWWWLSSSDTPSAFNNKQATVQQQEQEQQPLSNQSLVISSSSSSHHDNHETLHDPVSPLTPDTIQTLPSSSSGNYHHHHQDHPPSQSQTTTSSLTNTNNENRDLKEKLQRREEECRGLEIKLREMAQELQRLQLEQPSLLLQQDSTREQEAFQNQNQEHMMMLQELNSQLQELIQGKDLQLLNISTQVQQLTHDLNSRESQLGNLISLYSDQKQELERVQEESARNYNQAMEVHSAKIQEMDRFLQESKDQIQELSSRLEQAASDMATYRRNESMLKDQLDLQTAKTSELEDITVRQEQANQKVQRQLHDQDKRCRELAEELDQQMKTQNMLQGQLEDQIQRSRDLEDQLQQRTIVKSKIQEQLTAQVGRTRQLEEQLQQQSNEQTILQARYDDQVEKCQDLEKQLQQCFEENANLKLELARLLLDMEKCQQENEALKASEADARAAAGSDILALANDASEINDKFHKLQQEHLQLKSHLLDQTEKCQLLQKQVDLQKDLHGKQQARNMVLLKTNQTLTEMIDDRQQRCGELEQSVATLSHQLEKYQTRQGEEATKLEELRQLRREKQEIAQKLLASQTQSSHEERETLSKLASELEEQKKLVSSLKNEQTLVQREFNERIAQLQLQLQHDMELKKMREAHDMVRHRGCAPSLEGGSSALAGEGVIEALSFDPLHIVSEESKKEGKGGVPGINDILSSEVSFLFGLPSTTTTLNGRLTC